MFGMVPLYAPITYTQQQPSGGHPPGQDPQLIVPVPDYWYKVQVPGVGAVSEYHQMPWYEGPYQSGFSPQTKLTPPVFVSGPPLDARAYDLPLTTNYDPSNPGGSC